MSPVRTMLATSKTAIVTATIAAVRRRRLITGDDDQDGTGLDLRACGRAHLRDPPPGWREQLVLHLHRLERREPSASVDVVALIHVHGLEQAGHGCAQLDATGASTDRAAAGAEGTLVDDRGANIVTVEIEAEGVVRDQGDLVAFAFERDRPLPTAHRLAYIGRDDAVSDREAAVLADLHADATIVEGHLVSHQRSASSRAARAHGGSDACTARRSPRERIARTR